MAELRKCPFCGGEVKGYLDNHKKAMIECKKCNMYFGVKLEIGCELVEGWKATFHTKEELIEAWNTRKPMEAVVAELEKIKKVSACDEIRCDECKYTKICFEGEKSYKVALDRAISIVRGKE